jgi:hypothetical protein
MPPRKGLEVIPSAKRLIGSLRDMGYEFAPAVADLVDNSIEAGATQVDIWIEFHGDSSWVRIADNGCGMASLTLREAMRYGAERDYADGDLGKFGLGLKTASLSQCRRLTVSSRPKGGMLSAYCWDLDHVEETNRWEVFPVLKAELPQAVHEGSDAYRSRFLAIARGCAVHGRRVAGTNAVSGADAPFTRQCFGARRAPFSDGAG